MSQERIKRELFSPWTTISTSNIYSLGSHRRCRNKVNCKCVRMYMHCAVVVASLYTAPFSSISKHLSGAAVSKQANDGLCSEKDTWSHAYRELQVSISWELEEDASLSLFSSISNSLIHTFHFVSVYIPTWHPSHIIQFLLSSLDMVVVSPTPFNLFSCHVYTCLICWTYCEKKTRLWNRTCNHAPLPIIRVLVVTNLIFPFTLR